MSNNDCPEKKPLTDEYLKKMDAYWRAANYLAAAQLYMLKNPLLREPLTRDQVKKKIVGHWGTVPGQNFIYVHLNRVIKKFDLDLILLSGPGHGGNFFVANSYLEGTYSEVYPNVSEDEEGMTRLCKQFSFPGGISSHVAPETPGSINEGGELGYSLAHAFGAVFDNPGLIAATIVGDGVFARITKDEVRSFFHGCGWKPYFVEGDEPMAMHKKMAETLDKCIKEIKEIQRKAREEGNTERPVWPMIVLRTPKGWTGPKVVDGKHIEGSYRAHQVPITMDKPEHLDLLKEWLLSYKPEELFTEDYKKSSYQRRQAPERSAPSRLHQVRRRDGCARYRQGSGYARARQLYPRCAQAQCGQPQLPYLRARRDDVQPHVCGVRSLFPSFRSQDLR